MTLAEMLSRSATLPSAQQQELADFADFLLARYGAAPPGVSDSRQDNDDFARWVSGQAPARRDTALEQEPLFGLWADRAEMTDSVEYVRKLRANWREPGRGCGQ